MKTNILFSLLITIGMLYLFFLNNKANDERMRNYEIQLDAREAIHQEQIEYMRRSR